MEGFSQTQVSTLAVKDKLLVAGGFQGELICKHTTLNPDRKLLVIVGDDPQGLLVDAHSGKTTQVLHGHLDYSFASAWNPDGRTFATGNQDKSCPILDVRNLSKSLTALRGNLGAIRSIRFTSDGRFSWQWRSLQTLFTSLTWEVGTTSDRNWISLVTSQAYHLALTRRLSLLACGTAPMAASFSTILAESTHTSIHYFEVVSLFYHPSFGFACFDALFWIWKLEKILISKVNGS